MTTIETKDSIGRHSSSQEVISPTQKSHMKLTFSSIPVLRKHRSSSHKQHEVAEDIQRKLKKRCNIAQEILDTERRYNESLRLLNELFYVPFIQVSGTHAEIIPKKAIHDIFSNFADILAVNSELLRQINDRITNAEATDPMQVCLGEVFLKLTPYLRVYSVYVGNFNHAISLASELNERNPQFKAFVKNQCMLEQAKGRMFQTFLIEPVQRIPRYKLLLDDLLENTPDDHPDRHDLEKAHELIADVAKFVNEYIRRNEMILKMIEIEKTLVGFSESLLSPGRRFIRRGKVTKISRRSHQTRELILFSDILIYASYGLLEDQFLFPRKLNLEDCQIRDVPDSETVTNIFEIVNPEKSFAVYADSAEQKEIWISQLRETIAEWLSARGSFKIDKSSTQVGIKDYKAPVWVPDNLAEKCMLRKEPFSLLNRRHHCRACGKVVCHQCSDNFFYIPIANQERLARACDVCFQKIVHEGKFKVHLPFGHLVSEHQQIRHSLDGSGALNGGNSSSYTSSSDRLSFTFPRRSDVSTSDLSSMTNVIPKSQVPNHRATPDGDRTTFTSILSTLIMLQAAPKKCTLCLETYTFFRPMRKCNSCKRDVCVGCISKTWPRKCDPCLHDVNPDEVVVDPNGGGWSVFGAYHESDSH